MTIQDWGSIGDMIGGIAVVASLVYLSIQIRQNTQQISRSVEASKLGALERNIESANRMREVLILHPEVAALRTLSFGDDPLQFEGAARLIDSILENPGARAWLKNNDPDWRPEFRRFIEERLEALKRRT